MEENIVFSIIMPCYNSEEYVKTAIESVLQQTYCKWELIAVNDGSKDGTLSILQNYEKADPRIQLFSKENGGYVSALNYGLHYVKGDYFLFLGSDDWISPNLFRRIMERISDEKPDMIGFNTLKHWSESSEIDPKTSFDSFAASFHTNIADFQEKHPTESAIFFTRDTAKCFKRTLLGDTRYRGISGYDADGIFSMKLARKASSFMTIPVVGYHWTLRNDSVSGRPVSNEVNLDRIGNWIDFYQFLLSVEKKRLTAPEIFHVSYFIKIMQACYCNRKYIKRNKNPVSAGIAVVKLVLKQYDISLNRSSRFFLNFPTAWYLHERAVVGIHQGQEKESVDIITEKNNSFKEK